MSEKENVIQVKTYSFAVKAVNSYIEIKETKKEYDISRQFVRSATSIGANVEEAIGGYSKKDFIHKIQISYKEARETKYWLRLMKDTKIIETTKADLLLADVEEIIRIISAILRSSKV